MSRAETGIGYTTDTNGNLVEPHGIYPLPSYARQCRVMGKRLRQILDEVNKKEQTGASKKR